ncbi:MAG: ATP-binding cassette domain-containing protein [Spirochaetaceae bacterium]|nr:ATP-binding cassette domain-containing protein [Spirochaetaceae bacterium]MCF7947399.1 ATP-binding cassette domain-containing protein [Spirochaetia bacterium]MCF7950335.1 ATP-binding cassette domain-containing protein [Spirochaetaceae bacterium]
MIEIRELKKTFESHSVLDGIDLNLNKGETLTVMGISGCGKTTLLKLVIGLLSADSGSIKVDGKEVTGLTEKEFNTTIRRRMTMVFQQGALWDSKTVGENIELALNIREGISEPERRDMVIESLERVSMEGTENMYPEELSGGMIKRAAIARAIAARPDYLLYDEPTTGLDPVLSRRISELIIKLDEELRTSSLVISHDISSIPHFSDRVAMMHGGKIVLTCEAGKIWDQEDEVFKDFLHGTLENV